MDINNHNQPLPGKCQKKSRRNLTLKRRRAKRRTRRFHAQLILQEKTSIVKPYYLNVTAAIFKQKLSTILKGNQSIVQQLDNRKLTSLRQYAQLINDLYCLNYEQDIWQTVYNVSMVAGIWSTKLTPKMAIENNFSRYLFTTQANVEKRQKSLKNQLNKAQCKLSEYRQQSDFFATDTQLVLKSVTTLVGNELYHLRSGYEWGKILFQYDANDYRLVNLFYALKPTEDQIQSAKSIWQATAQQLKVEEEAMILKQHSYLLAHAIDNIEKQCTHPLVYTTEAEDRLGYYQNIIDTEKTKLLNVETWSSSPILSRVMDAIKIRQNNMIERTQALIKHQMKAFSNDILTKTIHNNTIH